VDGKYRTSVSNTGSHAGLLSALDQLIKQARQERGGK
jgi:thiol:disulfide interchange protein DsbA